MVDLVNSFENLLLQTHQSESYQIWVTTLSQGVVVRLSAAPIKGRHSGSSVMIRILIWHRFYAACPS